MSISEAKLNDVLLDYLTTLFQFLTLYETEYKWKIKSYVCITFHVWYSSVNSETFYKTSVMQSDLENKFVRLEYKTGALSLQNPTL